MRGKDKGLNRAWENGAWTDGTGTRRGLRRERGRKSNYTLRNGRKGKNKE